MTDPTGNDAMSADRLAQFEAEISALGIGGGGANKEKLGSGWGVGLAIVGGIVALYAWLSAGESAGGSAGINPRLEFVALGFVGVALAVVGIVLWLRNSITRYLRYWLVRSIYEQRAQTDRIVDALQRRTDSA